MSSAAVKRQAIAVLGAGSWGSALSICLANNGNEVRLWGHRPEHIQQLNQSRENSAYLPGIVFPPSVSFYSNLATCLEGVNDILMVVPSSAFASVLQAVKDQQSPVFRIAWATKGIDPNGKRLLSDVVTDLFGVDVAMAVLSGPSFAVEVATGQPTAVSLAGNDADFSQDLLQRFHSDCFRVYLNADLVGVQLCGVMKNILAIAVGVADGMGLGANSRAALITRGVSEMARLCHALKAQPETLMSLAGIGDIVLTCTDNQSRNRRFGVGLGQGKSVEQIFTEIGQEVEGAHNVAQVYALAQCHQVDMPITEQVYRLLKGQATLETVVNNLLLREPGVESV